MRLKDKVAVVTGASAGMGHSIALLFAREGASVVAVARRKEKLDELVKLAGGAPGKIVAHQGDVSVKAEVESMLDFAVKEFGKLNIVVNNAGIMDEFMPIAELTDELWEKVMATNLNSVFYSCRKAVNIFLAQGSGNIINVSSVGGLNGSRAGACYTASKHAVNGLTKNIGFQYAKSGIRCNAIAPGGVDTDIGVGIRNPSKFGMGMALSGASNVPRSASPEEIANVALFLASDESSIINGEIVVADTGWTAY